MKKLLVILLIGSLFFVACGDDEGGEENEAGGLPACGEADAEADVPGIPADFPKPDGAVYTGGGEAGPSFIAEGYFEGTLSDAFEAYSDAFANNDAGYEVTKDEQEERDAEVFFAGAGSTGQVNMFADCADQTKLRITIRPE